MSDKVLIAPSVLSADFLRLADDLESVSGADWVHYDVMDGHFVPNISFGPGILKQVRGATGLEVDVHLMVSNPDSVVADYVGAGADVVSFHMEATPHANRVAGLIRSLGASPAVALNPATPVCALDAIIEDVDMVLLMTVNPGFGGQSFIEGSLRKVAALRALCDAHGVSPLIEVDGGISAANAERVVAAGADVLVAGSSVFGAADHAAAIGALRVAAAAGLAARSR